MLVVETHSVLSGLPCSVCELPVRPAARVLLTSRDGQPRVMHAGLRQVALPPVIHAPYVEEWAS